MDLVYLEGYVVVALVQRDQDAIEELLQLAHPQDIRSSLTLLEQGLPLRLAVEHEEGAAGGIFRDVPKGQGLLPQLQDPGLQVLGKEYAQGGAQALALVVQLAAADLLDVQPKGLAVQAAGGAKTFQRQLTTRSRVPALPGRQADVVVLQPIHHNPVQQLRVPAVQGVEAACAASHHTAGQRPSGSRSQSGI